VLELIGLVVAILVVTVVVALSLVSGRRGKVDAPPPRPGVDYAPGTGDDAEVPRDTRKRRVDVVELPDSAPLLGADPESVDPGGPMPPQLEVPAPSAGRLQRLRGRLSRSQSTLGRGLFALLSRDTLDDDTWEEVEDTLLGADMGVAATTELVERLRTRGARRRRPDDLGAAPDAARGAGAVHRHRRPLAEHPAAPRRPARRRPRRRGQRHRQDDHLRQARPGAGRRRPLVVLGAADTFRAAAADQLQTWGDRVGAQTVRGPEGGDPASVAFDAVARGKEQAVDTVLIDTPAGCTPRPA
jgi:fused signal recognition particle receptor